MFFQFMESNKKGYGIMAFGAGEAEQQRDILSVKNPRNKGVGNGGTGFGSFLVLAFGFIGFFTVPSGREQFIPLIKGVVRISPKAVHEIIVR